MFSKFTSEPLSYFLIIGILIFGINGIFNSDISNENVIVITKDDIARITSSYKQIWKSQPTPEVLDNLLDDYILSEIYYQEALKLNLGHNDEIIKRRLRQKYEFLSADLVNIEEPGESELTSFYNENMDEYRNDDLLTFMQCYYKREEEAIIQMSRIKNQMNKLKGEPINCNSDPLHLQTLQENKSKHVVSNDFGMQFADSIFLATSGLWQGPIASGLGYHLVHILEVSPGSVQPFDAVKNDVIQDWKLANQKSFNDQMVNALRNNYRIIRRDEE